jgi:hypothetical protein
MASHSADQHTAVLRLALAPAQLYYSPPNGTRHDGSCRRCRQCNSGAVLRMHEQPTRCVLRVLVRNRALSGSVCSSHLLVDTRRRRIARCTCSRRVSRADRQGARRTSTVCSCPLTYCSLYTRLHNTTWQTLRILQYVQYLSTAVAVMALPNPKWEI